MPICCVVPVQYMLLYAVKVYPSMNKRGREIGSASIIYLDPKYLSALQSLPFSFLTLPHFNLALIRILVPVEACFYQPWGSWIWSPQEADSSFQENSCSQWVSATRLLRVRLEFPFFRHSDEMIMDLPWRLRMIIRQLGKFEIVENVYDIEIIVEGMGFSFIIL